ncbi:MAG TPA: transposase [Herpetosiphonaceae bacterium]
MLKTLQYRLYPTRTQQRTLAAMLETCRRWYNACLEERKTTYAERGVTIGKYDQLANVKVIKASNPFAAPIHSHVLQVTVADLDKAFQSFFRRVKAGDTPGYPRFKGRNRFHSFGFKEYGNGFKIDGRRLKLSGIGRVRVRWHRPLDGTIKTVRITRKADKWYACFACEVELQTFPATGRAVGVDVGIKSLLTTSDGDTIENPRWYRQGQRRLRVLQRRVARKKKGGKNRRKAVLTLQRHHEHVANQRKDFLNKVAHKLIAENDGIALENLRITTMVKNRHLAKSILDAGWGYLVQRLTSKAAEAGRVVCLINPAYTSKACSCCGTEFPGFDLAMRWVDCPRCGLSLDRDHNAAINIKNRAGHVRWESSAPMGGFSQEASPL